MAAFFPRNYNNYHGATSAEPGFTSLFRLLDDFDSYSRSQDKPARRQQQLPTFQPKFDVRETEKTYELHGELAGMNKQDVHVEFSDPQTMVIRGHIERAYTAGTPPSSSAAAALESAGSAAPLEDRPATPTATSAAAADDDDSASKTSSSSHKATVADEEDEQFTEVATPTTTTEPKEPAAVAAQPKTPADTAKYWVSERSIGEFSRSFHFPQRVDHDGVTAALSNGVLTVTVPKAKRHEVRRISVE